MSWSQCGNTGRGTRRPPSTSSTSVVPTMAACATDVPAARPTRMPSAANGRLPSQHARIIVIHADAVRWGRAAAPAMSDSARTAMSARTAPVRTLPAAYAHEGSGVRRRCLVQPLARSAASRAPPALDAAAIAAHAHMDTMKYTAQVVPAHRSAPALLVLLAKL